MNFLAASKGKHQSHPCTCQMILFAIVYAMTYVCVSMYYLFSSVHISSIGAENDRKVERSKERQQPYAEVLCLTFLLVFAFLILVSLAFGRVNIRDFLHGSHSSEHIRWPQGVCEIIRFLRYFSDHKVVCATL